MFAEKTIKFVKRYNTYTSEQKLSHNVFTPIELCDEIISKIDVKNKQILVLFNYEFVFTLVHKYGVERKNITYFSYFTETELKFLEKSGINYFPEFKTLDELHWSLGMKFDVVLGNPPYQNPNSGNESTNQGGGRKLYVAFMEFASNVVTENGYIALVTPSAVFKTTVYGKKGKGFSLMNNCKLVLAENNVSHHFNVGVAICYWICKKTDEHITATINGKQTNFNDVGFYANEPELQSIAEKLLTDQTPIRIHRDKDLVSSGLTTSRFAYLTFGPSAKDTNLLWEHSSPEKLKRLLKTNMFARVAWDGFVVLDKRWYHNFWSALYIHPKLTVEMNEEEIMDLYGLTSTEKSVIMSKNSTSVVK